MDQLPGIKIGGKEYEPSHQITTTVFLEKCRVSCIAAELLLLYIKNPMLKEEIDSVVKSVRPAEMAGLMLTEVLELYWDRELGRWLEPQELGEEDTDEETEVDE